MKEEEKVENEQNRHEDMLNDGLVAVEDRHGGGGGYGTRPQPSPHVYCLRLLSLFRKQLGNQTRAGIEIWFSSKTKATVLLRTHSL